MIVLTVQELTSPKNPTPITPPNPPPNPHPPKNPPTNSIFWAGTLVKMLSASYGWNSVRWGIRASWKQSPTSHQNGLLWCSPIYHEIRCSGIGVSLQNLCPICLYVHCAKGYEVVVSGKLQDREPNLWSLLMVWWFTVVIHVTITSILCR